VHIVQRIFRIVQRVEEWLLGWSIILIAALTIGNVISRSAFNESIAAAEELCQFLIILVCFVGLSYGASRGRHIRMTALYDLLSEPARRFVMTGISGFTAALLFFLAVHSLHYVALLHRLGSVSPALSVPLYVVYCAAPLGLVLAGIQYLFTLIRNVRGPGAYLSYDRKDEYTKEVVSGEI
jgi:C4-dicarboxylate transporter, DctQ subunit